MLKHLGLVLILLLPMLGCSQAASTGKLHKVGLLVPETINDQVWGTRGYKGLLQIQSEFNVDVFYKEGMDNEQAVRRAVDEFQTKGVNLIFGHGSEYGVLFNKISKDYPDIHFVFFNGEANSDNVTSLNFESNAMGFFAGMVAGKMTKTNHVGILASYEWQPEVDGYLEGAHYQNKDVDVNMKFVEHWDDANQALLLLNQMIKEGVDIVYVAGDGYNVPVIEKLKEEGLFAIGYVSDQSDLGEGAVLTSTVQHVDKLYELVAKKFNSNELDSGTLYFDFQDDVISLGQYSPLVDPSFIKKIEANVDEYKKTGKLPNEY